MASASAATTRRRPEWYKLGRDARRPRGNVRARRVPPHRPRGAVNREEAAKLFATAAKLGAFPPAAYDLGLLYLEGQTFPQDFKRAAELFRSAAQAGNPEAQYVLATLYKDGRGVTKDVNEATGHCSPRRPPHTMSTPRSSTRSRCSTAAASPRTRPRQPRC